MSCSLRPPRPLQPFELAALAALLAVLLVLALHGLQPTLRSASYTLRAALGILPLSFVLGVGLQSLRRVRGGRWRAYLRGVLTPSWLALWLRLWLACILASYAYFWLKLYVPFLNPTSWDEAFWHLDHVLHGGFSPSFAAIELLRFDGVLARAIDYWYALWLASLVAGISFFSASAELDVRRGLLLSCILLWGAGACLYAVFPALGPVYAFPGVWTETRSSLPLAHAIQELLWSNYQAVLAARQGLPAAFVHTRGVAAMPSLHVGFHALFTFWALCEGRRLVPVFAAMTLLTFAGSVLTGWHYAVDAYAGVALAWLCYRVGRRLGTAGS